MKSPVGETMMWGFFKEHQNVKGIMRDKGLAKLGDNLVNLCYSIAKSDVLGEPTGQKVRDSVLANAIRDTSVYRYIGSRTDSGKAADAYEAIMAYLWLTGKVTIESVVSTLRDELDIDNTTSRKKEGQIASSAFKRLLLDVINLLPT